MKILYIIRHAKSGQKDNPALKDFDRPLNERGEKEAAWTGERAKKLDLQILISSPAKRALDTAKVLAHAIHYPSAKIVTDITMYESSVTTLLKVIKNIDDTFDRAAIFGHNPEFSSLLSELSDSEQGEMPTAGIAGLTFAVDSWKNIAYKQGKLIFSETPNYK